MRKYLLIVAVAAWYCAVSATGSWAVDEKITADQIPAKVMATLKARFASPQFTATSKAVENGKVIYDLEFTQDGRKCEMDIAEDGTPMNVEREIAAKDLPKGAVANIESKFPKATIKVIMESKEIKGSEEKLEQYEVTLELADKDKTEKEVLLGLDGKILPEEKPAEPAKK